MNIKSKNSFCQLSKNIYIYFFCHDFFYKKEKKKEILYIFYAFIWVFFSRFYTNLDHIKVYEHC